jgi:hypothetical protein
LQKPQNQNYISKKRKSNFQKNRSLRVKKILKNQKIFEVSQKHWYRLDNFRAGN